VEVKYRSCFLKLLAGKALAALGFVEMIRLDDVFAELGGFALVEPARLSEFLQGKAHDQDLLTQFTTTELGERVLEEGIVIPLLGVTPGFYRLIVRQTSEPSVIGKSQITSRGWVLGTISGKLILCGLGYLTQWDAEHSAHHRFELEPGWYEVEIQARLLEATEGSEEGVYELILTKVPEKPEFAASTTQSLSLLD